MSLSALAATRANLSPFYKELFPDKRVEDLVAYDRRLYSQMRKSDTLEGKLTRQPTAIDSPQGMSVDFQSAQANVTHTPGVEWEIDVNQFYAMLHIEGLAIAASRSKKGAFMKQRESEMERLLEQVGQQLGFAVAGDGSAALGQIDTITPATPGAGFAEIQLLDVEDIIKIHRNMTLDFNAVRTGSAGTLKYSGGTTKCRVVDVNEDAGSFTVSPDITVLNWDGSTGAVVAAADYVYRQGDYDAYMQGVSSWIPLVTPSTTPFLGVNRAQAPVKLAGHRQTWLGTIEQTAKRLDARMRRVKRMAKKGWLSYINFHQLDTELGVKGIREEGKAGEFGFASLAMVTPGGRVKWEADPYMPEDRGFILNMEDWEIKHLLALPHIIVDDGQRAMRLHDADGVEIRVRYWAETFCHDPYAQGVFAIS